jgi:hypothetical protein
MKKKPAVFLFVFLILVFIPILIILKKPTTKSLSGLKTLSDLNYSLEYPADWFLTEKAGGKGIKILANYQTNNCFDDNGQPINSLVDKGCITLVNTQQVIDLADLPINKYLDRQFGEYDMEIKTYRPVSYELVNIQGNQFIKLIAKNTLYYLIPKGENLFQISLTPADSDYLKQFGAILSSIVIID